MSDTLELCCLDCKEHLWIGQVRYGKSESAYVYGNDEALRNLNTFVRRHVGHALKIVGAGGFDTLGGHEAPWVNIEDMPKQESVS